MRLPRTAVGRCRTALLDELLVGFLDGLHAFDDGLDNRVGRLDVGEPHGLARLAEDVDVGHSRLADVLDGLLGFGGGGVVGFGHGCVGLSAFRHKNDTTILGKAIGLEVVTHCTFAHAVVLRVLVCVRVCVKLPLHTKFPNELLLQVHASVKPEPVVELDDCIESGNDCHDDEGQFQITHKILTLRLIVMVNSQ